MNYANAGIPVLFKEVSQEALDKGLGIIKKNYAATVAKGRLTQQQMDERMALIEPTISYDKFKEADIVTEAVFEEMALKKKVFGEIEKATRPDCILASNTSTLNIDEIAASTSRPEMVIGHHYFSPANVMRVIEIVRGKKSSDTVIASSMAIAKQLGQGRHSGGKLPRVPRKSHVPLLPARSPVPAGRRRQGRGSRRRALRLRHGDGPVGRGRSGRARRRLAHSQGVQAPGAARNSPAAGGGSDLRTGTLRAEDRRRLVQV